MKITCQACAAKYTIADEKVVGKVVKIRCKKCGANIVINGTDSGAEAGIVDGGDQATQIAAHGQWAVNVADGDQRTMSEPEIAAAYRGGVVNADTYIWKDGMPDWLPLRDIPAFRTLAAGSPTLAETQEDDAATKIQEAPSFLFAAGAAPGAPARPSPPPARPNRPSGNGSGSTRPAAAATAAARRAAGRPPPAADLFGSAAQAGGEDDVMTSAPAGMPQAHEDPHKMTGARNENSVLFSLNALTGKSGVVAPAPMGATSEASGLIDIRQLSAQIGIGKDKKQSRIDDIMNLAGGGAFAPSLTAPMLAAPPADGFAAPAASASVAPAPRSKEIVFLALGAGAFVVVAAVGVALMLTRHGTDESDTKGKTAASASVAEPAPAESAARDAPQPSATETPTASGPSSNAQTAAAPKDTAPKTAAAAPVAHETAHEAYQAPRETHVAAAAAAAAPDTPFNMGEAKARLAAIAGSVQSCKRGEVSGTGRVVIVFAPNGGTQSATVTGPPFEGTPTGACVAVKFRGARVPPFGGSPFSVAKSFTIN